MAFGLKLEGDNVVDPMTALWVTTDYHALLFLLSR